MNFVNFKVSKILQVPVRRPSSPGEKAFKSRYRDASRRLRNTALWYLFYKGSGSISWTYCHVRGPRKLFWVLWVHGGKEGWEPLIYVDKLKTVSFFWVLRVDGTKEVQNHWFRQIEDRWRHWLKSRYFGFVLLINYFINFAIKIQ